jgi:hypothetical protein
MHINVQTSWIAFAHGKCVASGAPRKVATELKAFVDSNPEVNVLVLDAVTSESVEIDLRGSMSTVLRRLPKLPTSEVAVIVASKTPATRAAGRPKLGVIAREVTLLPRHWEWLATQPGGASVALRKLVEHAQHANRHEDRVRQAREAAYRFMSVMAGNEPGFEEATRALFASDLARLRELIKKWPADIRKHTLSLAENLTVNGDELEHAT